MWLILLDSGLCLYYLYGQILISYTISKWITFSTQSCQIWFSFWNILLHLSIKWLTISFLFPHIIIIITIIITH